MTPADRNTVQSAALAALDRIAAYPRTVDFTRTSFSEVVAAMATMARDAAHQERSR